MAEGTRRAYGVDLGQFAAVGDRAGPGAARRSPPARCAATRPLLSDRRDVAATVARKLAALRAFYRALREHGHVAQNPADLMPAPKRPATLPQGPPPRRGRRAARPHPGLDAARAARPRPVRARLRVRPARRGARRPRRRLASTSTPRSCASRARARRPASSPPASRRCGRSGATSSARARRWRPSRRRARAVPLEVRPPALDVGRPAPPAGLGAPRRGPRRHLPARAAPLLRDPPARRRRRPAGHPGAARPRLDLHDPDLHSGRVRAAAGRLREEPPTGLEPEARHWRPTSRPSSCGTSGAATRPTGDDQCARAASSSPTRRS